MKSLSVSDPRGKRWKVSVRILPWELRWRAPRPRDDRTEVDQEVLRPRWYDFLDISHPFGALNEGLGGFMLALLCILVLVSALFLLMPVFVFLIEALIVALLVIGAIVVRVLFRQPWLVDAVSDDGTHMTWKVVGYRRSRKVVDEIGRLIAQGTTSPSIHDAAPVR